MAVYTEIYIIQMTSRSLGMATDPSVQISFQAEQGDVDQNARFSYRPNQWLQDQKQRGRQRCFERVSLREVGRQSVRNTIQLCLVLAEPTACLKTGAAQKLNISDQTINVAWISEFYDGVAGSFKHSDKTLSVTTEAGSTEAPELEGTALDILL